jgi:hypothetical protein
MLLPKTAGMQVKTMCDNTSDATFHPYTMVDTARGMDNHNGVLWQM